MDEIAYLIDKKIISDSIGNQLSAESKIEIFVSEESINRIEYFSAAQNGMQSDLKLVTCLLNYGGQKEIEYCNKRFTIYRTYKNKREELIELYAKEKLNNEN